MDTFPRRPTDSPILNRIGAHKGNSHAFPSKGGKKLHKGIPKKSHDKVPLQDAIDQKEQEMVAKQLEQLLLNQAQPDDEKTERVPPVAFERPLSLSQNVYKSWKSDIAHQSRNAVCKILSSVIEFDWQHPFKRSDMGDAIGTGFFVDNDGTFVTNAHVIEEAARIWITIPSEGEKRYPAEVLGVCFDVDLAVLRAKNAPVTKILEFGDSNAVQYGQEVLTLGYPLGMDSLKLTEGIISGREEGLFQTDAPLNPGNSGGPMLNSEGKVIGINVAIVEKSQNVGFAIPVFHLVQLYESLRTRPKDKLVVHKPILGCDWSNSSDALMRFSGTKESADGIFISKSYEGFPLYNAGVRDGDILHSFNGFALDNFGHAVVPWSPYARASIDSLISLCTFDSKPEITYSREGKLLKGTVNFEDPDIKGIPKLPAVREYYPPYEKIDYVVIAGMVVMDLTLNHIEELHENSPTQSVLKTLTPIATSFEERLKPSIIVADVLVGSLLARDGVFPPGTLLSEVNGIKVKDLQEFRAAVMKPVNKNGELFLTFKSKSSEFGVLPLQEVFKEEFELSEMYMYNISPLVLESLAANPQMVDYCTKGDKQMKKKFNALLKAHREGGKVEEDDE